jgi:hypothetical protein
MNEVRIQAAIQKSEEMKTNTHLLSVMNEVRIQAAIQKSDELAAGIPPRSSVGRMARLIRAVTFG